MSGIEVASRSTFSDHFRWPTVWEYAAPVIDWYEGAREKYMAQVDPARLVAAAEDLRNTLIEKPGTFWCYDYARRDLAGLYNIPVHMAHKLMRDAPGSSSPAANIWCAKAIASGWPSVKRKVFEAVPSDRTVTFNEVATAVAPGIDVTSSYAALVVLTNTSRTVTCLRNEGDREPQFIRSRPRSDRLSYADVYRVLPDAAPSVAA